MRRASVIGIAMLWLGSLVATATIGWHLASRHFAAEPAPAGPVSDVRQVSAAETRPRDTRETASMEALERENAALRQEVEQSHAGEKDAENERLRLVLKQALRQVAEPRTRNDTISAAWRRGFEAMSRNRERGGMFAGMDDGLSLAGDMARLGAPAMSFLAELVGDTSVDMKEREAALFTLSHIRDKAALAELLKIRAPDVTELDYPYDLIQLQVSSLPTSDVREFIPEINRQIAQELGAGEQGPERTEVLLTLSLVHGDRDSLRLLYDPRVLNEDLTGAIGLAGEIHTPQAHQFLQWVAGNSRNERHVALATGVIDAW